MSENTDFQLLEEIIKTFKKDYDNNKVSLRDIQKEERLKRSYEFIELYKQGLNYQQIADKYGISRERVRQILSINPEFEFYKQKQKEDKIIAEKLREEQAKQDLYERSIGFLYPERVAELWDYEKNGDLKPEEVLSCSSSVEIWLKCPIDGYSWKKTTSSITAIWKRNGTSGCPVCAGKTKKSKKQPSLIEAYPDFVQQYWDYEKNQALNLEPNTLTCGSNKKVWFKCPDDGNEWQIQIASIVNQQWSQGNAGCRICNGTENRKQGTWKRREPIALEFPNEVAKYWFYEANNELGLDPMKLTSRSSKEAFFKCPIDGHEWVATITAIAGTSWKRGNSGCPYCRGFISTDKSSLINLYPQYIQEYWNYKKNNQLGLNPEKLTRGSSKEAWFKCPIDGYEWKTIIGSITRCSWKLGNNGCPKCGSGWTLEAIRQFVASLEEHIPNLTPAERYKIFEQSGVLDTQNKETLKIIKDIIKGKLSGAKLGGFLKVEDVKASEAELENDDNLTSENELKVIDGDSSQTSKHTFHSNNEDINQNLDSEDETNNQNNLPKVRIQKSLEFLNSQVVASADQEAVEFFVASRRNRIWAEIFEDESAIEGLEEFTEEGYGRRVRDEFLDEYYQAKNIKIPSGWSFRLNGKIIPPIL